MGIPAIPDFCRSWAQSAHLCLSASSLSMSFQAFSRIFSQLSFLHLPQTQIWVSCCWSIWYLKIFKKISVGKKLMLFEGVRKDADTYINAFASGKKSLLQKKFGYHRFSTSFRSCMTERCCPIARRLGGGRRSGQPTPVGIRRNDRAAR